MHSPKLETASSWMSVLCNTCEKQKKNPEVFILHIQSFRWDLISSCGDQNDSDFVSLSSPPPDFTHLHQTQSLGWCEGHYTKPALSSLLLPWHQEEEETVQWFYRFLAENQRGFAQLRLKEQGGEEPSSVCSPPGWAQQSVLQLGTEVPHSALTRADGPDSKIMPVLNSAKSHRLLLAKKPPQQSSGIKFKLIKSCIFFFFPKSAWVEKVLKAAWGWV